jgi:hypothetical protein
MMHGQKNIKSCLYDCLSLPARKSHIFYCLTVFLSVARLAVAYFSTPSYERHDLRGKKLSNTKCVF